jgi:hypothetical protein
MPFIGQEPITGAFHKLDAITTSPTNTYNLLLNGGAYSPASANHLMVSLNGVIQSPGSSFTISGSQITFVPSSGTLSSSDSIDFIMAYGDVLNIGTVSDGTVSTNKLTNNAVTTAKIGSGAVTDAKIAGMAASKLTGALPAISGAALTGISSPTKDYARVTFSGPNVAHGTVTVQTPTLRAESNNFTIANTSQIIPSVAGDYLVVYQAGMSLTSSGGYTPTSYIYKNNSVWASFNDIKNYAGGSNLGFPTAVSIVSMNGSSDYFKFAIYTNSSATGTSTYGTAVMIRIAD